MTVCCRDGVVGGGSGEGEAAAAAEEEEGGDWVEDALKPQIKGALRHALRRARGRLDGGGGQFCLLGADLVRRGGIEP